MTYGENSGRLPAELATLLRQHRIQQRLGGAGLHTLPETTTPAERADLGRQIRRYRHAVLTWCLQAVRAADPYVALKAVGGDPHGPVEQLLSRLTTALNASTAGLPPLAELNAPQEFALVESWRQAARAAALGEHDFGAGVGHGHLSKGECLTVLKDASDITRAVVCLDRRYQRIPGWDMLSAQVRLLRAAEACAVFAGQDHLDYSVDLRGWRPPASPTVGPSLPGIGGVVQAESNVLVGLNQFPNAQQVRLILDSQRIVSHEMSARIATILPALAATWAARATTFGTLIRETRDVRGLVGHGEAAAAQASIAAARAQQLGPITFGDARTLGHLERMFAGIDLRLAAILEQGAFERLYFRPVRLPRLVEDADSLVKPVRMRYVPIDLSTRTGLLHVVRRDLRPSAVSARAPAGAVQSRVDFEAAISHRPDRAARVQLSP